MKTRRSKRQKRRTQRGGNKHILREYVSAFGLWLLNLEKIKSKKGCFNNDPGLCVYTKEECCLIIKEDLSKLLIGVDVDYYIKVFNTDMGKVDAISLNVFFYYLLRVGDHVAHKQGIDFKQLAIKAPALTNLSGGGLSNALNSTTRIFSMLSTASTSLGFIASKVVGREDLAHGFACISGVCYVISAVSESTKNYSEGKLTLGGILTKGRNALTYSGVVPGLEEPAQIANLSWVVSYGAGVL